MTYIWLVFGFVVFCVLLSAQQQRVKKLEGRVAGLERRIGSGADRPPVDFVEAARLTSQQLDAIMAEVRRGRKIMAIKLYREYTGVGLKEAKDAVERIAF